MAPHPFIHLYLYFCLLSLTLRFPSHRSGLTDRVHGISCARMAGLPASVCELAASKSKEIEDTDQANLAKRKIQHIRSLFVALQKAQHQDSEVNATQVVQYARDFLNS